MTSEQLAEILWTERRRALDRDTLVPLAETPANVQAVYRRFAAEVAEKLDLPRLRGQVDRGNAEVERDRAFTVAATAVQTLGEQTARTIAAEAERNQLRYERRLLGAARELLDRVATGGLRGWTEAHREAADLAQRIVDEIGHPATDEPALGPSCREQLEKLSTGISALYARCMQGARDNAEYYERVPTAKYELGKAAVWDGVAELLRELVPSVADADHEGAESCAE